MSHTVAMNNRRGCIPDLVAAQARRTPDALAVVAGHEQVTYRELDERANQLAWHLRAHGVGTDVVVALRVARSLDMVVGLLGILKAGGAYLPVEEKLPEERAQLILHSARPGAVLTQHALARSLPSTGAPVVCLDDRAVASCPRDPIGVRADPSSLAYVIYTSGSTGVPKGIMVDHRALRDRMLAKAEIFRFAPHDRVLQFTALGFDAAAAEIYPALLSGAALVVHTDPSWASPPELIAECVRQGVTSVMLPPVYLQLLLDTLVPDGDTLPWLRFLLTGGETIPVDRLASWARLVSHRPRFVYAYGPTETTVTATLYESSMDPAEIAALAKIPIGRPMPGTAVHILGDDLMPVTPGGVGELCISGAGLARGYLGDAALTAERFVPCPFAEQPGGRMYLTGDLGRLTPAGDLEFMGRRDSQVKVRGFRVDLGDVENALLGHPGLGGAVVTTHGASLVAYCAPRPQSAPRPAEIRTYLRSKLPDYMVPSTIMIVAALPLTPGGKIDRAALPEPSEAAPPPGSCDGDPSSPIEVMIAEIWCDVLGRERVGTGEDFFEVGGDSLLANRVLARVNEALGLDLALRTVFSNPTVAGLATVATAHAVSASADPAVLGLLDTLESAPQDGTALLVDSQDLA
ncbi:MAG TPA: non-ribosomal peptide synthetase [Streptosporangiaceae bacterium]|nr:non-ribosomal peptide synthetase [Streptosporangiaceae bacterium]